MRTTDRDFGSIRRPVMFGATFGNLFASGPKLNYDVEPAFDARAFGVWTHARGRCKVRRRRNHEVNESIVNMDGNGHDENDDGDVSKHAAAPFRTNIDSSFDCDSRFAVDARTDGWTDKQTDARMDSTRNAGYKRGGFGVYV